MQKYLVIIFSAICLIAGSGQAKAGNSDGADQGIKHKGQVSSSDENAERGAKLKARIRALEKKQADSAKNGRKVETTLEHKTVRGSDQIKAKMKAVEESKSRQWLQDWWSEHVTKRMDVKEDARKRSFKQKLAEDRAKRQAKKKARENKE